MSRDLIGYLENDDAEGIKSMLCDITKSSSDTEEEIEAALVFFDGKVTSRDEELTGSEESVTNGQIEYLIFSSYIGSIETDKNKTYEIKFYAQVVNTENPNKEGISEIIITDEGGNECIIGAFLDRH